MLHIRCLSYLGMVTHTCDSTTRATEAEDHKLQFSMASHSPRPSVKTKAREREAYWKCLRGWEWTCIRGLCVIWPCWNDIQNSINLRINQWHQTTMALLHNLDKTPPWISYQDNNDFKWLITVSYAFLAMKCNYSKLIFMNLIEVLTWSGVIATK